MASAIRHTLVSFGMFEVDLDAGEIRRSGFRVRLPGQPFRLLVALLARPGEILTREEIQREIWGSDVNVDFERGIAGAVNKLREALGDSAEQPRYIETLARKGYRFIAPVTLVSGPGSVEVTPIDPPESPRALLEPDLAVPVVVPYFEPDHGATASGGPASAQRPAMDPAKRTAAQPGRASSLLPRVLLVFCAAITLMLLTAVLTARYTQQEDTSAPPRIEQLTQTTNIYPGPPNPETFLSIATDGPRLYAPVLIDGRSQLSSLALNGTDIQPISMPGDLSSGAITGISPDGSRLLVRSLQTREPEQPLWIVPTTGSGASRVGEVLAHDATWMPGSDDRVLVASGNNLGLIDLGTSAVSPYVSLPGRAFWLRWSPDGRILRFTLLDPVSHSSSLWELDSRTHRAHPLSFPQLKDMDICCGSWTPSGDMFVFQASNARDSNLWVVRGRRGPVQLTNGPVRFSSPLPSREGHTVFAFGATQPGGTRVYDRALHRFVPAPHFLELAQRASYSRDGAWVAWTDHDEELWRARSKDGADLQRLTGRDLDVFSACWSPDGKQLLLMARYPGETWQIYTVSAGGGAIHRVLSDRHNLADPEWSADGSKIVFGREADLMGQENSPHDIQMLDLKTRQVTPVPGSTDLFSPRWSPDGQWLAALSRDQQRLLLYNLRTGVWKTVFTGSAADPVWSADSRAIYFHAFAQANSAIMRAKVYGVVETVADLSKVGLPSAENYFFTGVTPDGLPLIEPRVGTGNLFSIELQPH